MTDDWMDAMMRGLGKQAESVNESAKDDAALDNLTRLTLRIIDTATREGATLPVAMATAQAMIAGMIAGGDSKTGRADG